MILVVDIPPLDTDESSNLFGVSEEHSLEHIGTMTKPSESWFELRTTATRDCYVFDMTFSHSRELYFPVFAAKEVAAG